MKSIKYILNRNGKEELYVLPDEYKNLMTDESSKISAVRDRLKKNLRIWSKRYPIRSDINAKRAGSDEDMENALRSLGYLN